MNSELPNKEIVVFSNFMEFEGRKLSFRQKLLFDITGLPKFVPLNVTSNSWIVNRKQLSLKRAKELVVQRPVEVDISSLQWYQQERIKGCFHLEEI